MVQSVSEQFVLERNDALSSFTGLENLTTVESFTVLEHPALTGLTPLAGLKSMKTARLSYNPKLSTCALQQLATRCGVTDAEVVSNGPCN